MAVEDPLKSLDQVHAPDPRHEHLVETLKDTHGDLASIVLDETVPESVRQLFETAKNVSLYSWFVYRFHQVAEMVAYQAMDMALRIRRQQEPGCKPGRRRFRADLEHAVQEGWIRNEGFSDLRQVAAARAKLRSWMAAIQAHQGEGHITLPEISKLEIERELAELPYVENLVKAIPQIRNELAHGSTMLHPNSRRTLRVVADTLNQLFSGDER